MTNNDKLRVYRWMTLKELTFLTI